MRNLIYSNTFNCSFFSFQKIDTSNLNTNISPAELFENILISIKTLLLKLNIFKKILNIKLPKQFFNLLSIAFFIKQ